MPYAWLFRLGDVLAGGLLLWIAVHRQRPASERPVATILLCIIAVTMIIDPLFTTNCHIVARKCLEYGSPSALVHDVESVIAATAVFTLALWDGLKRKRTPSILYAAFQVLYGILLLTNIVTSHQFNTPMQLFYQAIGIVWLAWLVRDQSPVIQQEWSLRPTGMHKILAFWVALNGMATILLSLLHLNYFGFIGGLYFTNDTAWVAQYGMIVGVALLYLSRHLARGEYRARQLVLILFGVEVLKYAAIAPQPILLGLYIVTFVSIFVTRDYFNRSRMPQAWQSKAIDILLIVAPVAAAVWLMGYALLRDPHYAPALRNAIVHYQDLVLDTDQFTDHHLRSSLLAHTVTALAAATMWFVGWTLFRPSPRLQGTASSMQRDQARILLEQYSQSSEDFFKLWPQDKQYFWSPDQKAFVAYTVVGPVAFALADPIAATAAQRTRLLHTFLDYCHAHGWKVCFLLVATVAREHYQTAGLKTIQIGASAIIDVQTFTNKTTRDKWWRWQKNKALKQNYTYMRSTPPHDIALIAGCRQVSDAWLQAGGHKEQGFALGYFDPTYLQQSTLHVLRDEAGNIVAFANQLPVFNNNQQTTIDLMRFRPETRNAMPYLLLSMLTYLQEAGEATHFDLGFVPLAQTKGRLATVAKIVAANRFSAAGLEQFKNKFDPQWSPNYIAYDGDLGDLALITLYLEKAMAPSD